MNLVEQVFGLIRQYEKEREPDVILANEFKDGKRLAEPEIQVLHSVGDFKKWLLDKGAQ
jgi:hypothetical protein